MSKLVGRMSSLSVAALKWTSPRAKTIWNYSKVELRPPTPAEVSQAIPMAKKGLNTLTTGRYLDMNFKEAFRNTLVGVEILMWFFVGEMIGRRSIIGYTV